MVQDVSIDDGLTLETWHHVVRRLEVDRLVEIVGGLDGIRVEPVEGESAQQRMIEYGGICSMLTVDGRAFTVHAAEGRNRFTALAQVAAACGILTEAARTRVGRP